MAQTSAKSNWKTQCCSQMFRYMTGYNDDHQGHQAACHRNERNGTTVKKNGPF